MFAFVHNAGRSQMTAAYADHQSAGQVKVRSAGSTPAESVNFAIRVVLLEDGIHTREPLRNPGRYTVLSG